MNFLGNKFGKTKRAAKRGFTLVEIILASTVFVLVGMLGITIFTNVIRIQYRIQLENAIFEDGRFMMERIAREIRLGTLDYEEYYRADTGGLANGENFGCYAERFYNPGSDGAIGALCNDFTPATSDCVILKSTLDVNTGQHPYAGFTGGAEQTTDANAFCDEDNHGASPGDCLPSNLDLYESSVLYLLNAEGTRKTFIGQKLVSGGGPPEYAVSILRLNGQDTDLDGIYEDWVDVSGASPDYTNFCSSVYDCTGIDDLDANLAGTDGAGLFEGFVPLTPLRSNITSLKFYLSPLEDPRKAYAETVVAEGIQQQPHVTVVMTLQPAASELENFGGAVPTVTLQTTVSSRVYNEVKSYRGEDVC